MGVLPVCARCFRPVGLFYPGTWLCYRCGPKETIRVPGRWLRYG